MGGTMLPPRAGFDLQENKMKRYSPSFFAFSLAAVAAIVPCWSQTVTKIAPMPSQWGLWGAHFLDAQKGFACGGMKGFYRTLDGGQSWTTIALPGYQDSPMYNVTFLDANVGIVIGNSAQGSQDIFRTTNGGATWSQVAGFPLGGSWYHQDYVSTTTGFIGSNGAIVRTTNAGATWELRSFYPSCPSMTGMDFVDANVGLVSGGLPTFDVGVFKTIDGGFTWALKLPIASDDVIYLSPSVVIASTLDGISKSEDGGETWTPTGAVVPTGMVDIEKLDASTVVGVSGSGDIWRTADGGFNWSQMWVGEGDLPGNWSVKFTTPLLGTVVGVRGLMYRTQDGGLTWSRFNRGASFDANGLAALSNDTIVTVGHHGFVQTITNNGPWSLSLVDPPVFGRDTSYSAVSAVGTGFVYAAGHWGGLARSVDGGTHWQNLIGAVSLDFYANDVKFTDAQHGWMTGWDYSAGTTSETYLTNNGGDSWQVVASGNFPGIAIDAIGSSVWIQSGARTNWRSTDDGATFVAVQLPHNSGSAPSVSDMSFANDSLGYSCGYDGYLAKTLNGGATWTQVGSVSINTHNLGVLAQGDELWVCGARAGGGNAFIKRSMDRGQTWETWNFGGQYTTPFRMVRTATRLYASGYNGEIWRMDGLPNAGAQGDVNGDGHVDLSDLAMLLSSFGLCSGDAGFNAAADFDASGCVELADLALLLANFGAAP